MTLQTTNTVLDSVCLHLDGSMDAHNSRLTDFSCFPKIRRTGNKATDADKWTSSIINEKS